MNIAIASGKGGTGKTTVTVNLAALLAPSHNIILYDCDVEEPNTHLFLTPLWHTERICEQPVPVINQTSCAGETCRHCIDACRFRALIWMGEVMTFPELCHGCGLCMEVCQENAVAEGSREIGTVRQGTASVNGHNISMVSGLMRIGEAMAPPLIRDTLTASLHRQSAQQSETVSTEKLPQNDTKNIALRDCPPGTSCPMITAVDGADAAVLVTEPTPFGLHDLSLAVETMRTLNIPFGVVINRDGIGDDRVERYCEQENIPILARLPHSMEAATACSAGKLIVTQLPEQRVAYRHLWENILLLCQKAQIPTPMPTSVPPDKAVSDVQREKV